MEYLFVGVISLGLGVYLLYALLKPEKFQENGMTANGWLQIAIFFLLILACAKPLGSFIANVMEGKRT
jgi:K+-transporting ATPase KdpF subunit